jgi:hypothetical protein
MMEIKFGSAQHVEAKTMEVLWLGVMTVMRGITGKAFRIFVRMFGIWINFFVKCTVYSRIQSAPVLKFRRAKKSDAD